MGVVVKIAFVGHLSLDVNVIKGVRQEGVGGGVFYGSVAASRLGAEARVYTKCAPADRSRFGALDDAGVEVIVLPSETSTSIRNEYPTDDPDDRTSRLLTRAAPFTEADLEAVDADVVHVNPLWKGEFPDRLIPKLKERAPILGGDAQGFLRVVTEDGRMEHRDWSEKGAYLPHFDLLKVDHREMQVLTGLTDIRTGAERLRAMGPSTVVITHRGGVWVFDGDAHHQAPFGPYTMAGRTGRGDTCTAAFFVTRGQHGVGEATEVAARVTTAKMQYRGPYRKSD